MKKIHGGIVIGIVVCCSMNMLASTQGYVDESNEQLRTLWSPEEEGDHFPCGCEWWTLYAALELDDGTHWDVLIEFQYETNQTNRSDLALFILYLYCFNRDNGDVLDYTQIENKWTSGGIIPFYFKKNTVDIRYQNDTITGLYPYYSTHIEDEKHGFALDLNFNAKAEPHWVGQEASNGYFPWGLGWARYGFIPRCDVSGDITIEGAPSTVTGVGYYEHAWGNFTYAASKKPVSALKEFITNLNKTAPFIRWCLSERTSNLFKTMTLSTDNFFGYEWGWAFFENGWNLQFGIFHTLDFIAEGSVFGEVSLTPDGTTYWDFAGITINCSRYFNLKEVDVLFPLDMELTAKKDDRILHLHLNTTTDPYRGLCGVYPRSLFCCGQGGIHTAGVVDGYYRDANQTVLLHGMCSSSPCKQYLTTKHNSLHIEFIRPPHGRGFRLEVVSHRFGFEMLLERQWRPYVERHFYFNRLDYTAVPEPEPPLTYPNATYRYVGGNGEDNFTRIQEALDHANDGDSIYVYNGTYLEDLVITKTIRLLGEDKHIVVLEAQENDGIRIIADYVEIAGFTINAKKTNRFYEAALDISSSGNYIHDNIITQSEWYGIAISNASCNLIEYNNIVDNDIGIWLDRSNDNKIRYNNITDSKLVGVWSWPYSMNNRVSYNNFMGNAIHSQNSDAAYRNTWLKNYWSDYSGLKVKRFADFNNDSIGEIPYKISRREYDRHPMMKSYVFSQTGEDNLDSSIQ